jgi:hypothetical protein
MQSSSVKSEMYPVWAVALLTLFGCVDPITSYVGLDYKGPLLKVLFQLCLYFGYVLLMSASTISNVVGNLAIGVLSAITFIKGFHRSLALVVPSRMRPLLGVLGSDRKWSAVPGKLVVPHNLLPGRRIGEFMNISMYTISLNCNEMLSEARFKVTANDTRTIEDVCIGYFLSHSLQRRFLGLNTATKGEASKIRVGSNESERGDADDDDVWLIDCERTLKVIEFELAFLYEFFYTSNAFLQFYEARTSCLWAFASFTGVCFVCVAAATPGTMASRYHRAGPGAGTAAVVVVDTTTADLVVTLVILVSLALLQLLQLVRCWTSNWARVALAFEYARRSRQDQIISNWASSSYWCWIRLKAFVLTRINWFDKYLWQDSLGQYSVPDSFVAVDGDQWSSREVPEWCGKSIQMYRRRGHYPAYNRLMNMLALRYIKQVLRELLLSDTKGGAGVRLHEDVKTSVADFLGKIKSNNVWEWSRDNRFHNDELPYSSRHLAASRDAPDAYKFTEHLMMWHVATWYCCQAAGHKEPIAGGAGKEDSDTIIRELEKNRRVATTLSKYCVYLVSSLPELLPGPSAQTKRAFDAAASQIKIGMERGNLDDIRRKSVHYVAVQTDVFGAGWFWGKRLCNETSRAYPEPLGHDDPWKVLALLWVKVLLCAAPYGDLEAHKQRLSKGGEFITHIWAMLYHLGIDRWKWEAPQQPTLERREKTSEDVGEEEIAASQDITDDVEEIVYQDRLRN